MQEYFSPNMPEIPYSPPIGDLFANVQHNWGVLTPVLSLLFGILFFGFLAKKIKDTFWGDDKDD